MVTSRSHCFYGNTSLQTQEGGKRKWNVWLTCIFKGRGHRGQLWLFLHQTWTPMAWWRHRMETFSVLLALCAVTGGFPSQRPVTRSFDVFFDLHLNKRLSKQSRLWWFEMPSYSLWCHCNGGMGHFWEPVYWGYLYLHENSLVSIEISTEIVPQYSAVPL